VPSFGECSGEKSKKQTSDFIADSIIRCGVKQVYLVSVRFDTNDSIFVLIIGFVALGCFRTNRFDVSDEIPMGNWALGGR